jgi:hypothetical protein
MRQSSLAQSMSSDPIPAAVGVVVVSVAAEVAHHLRAPHMPDESLTARRSGNLRDMGGRIVTPTTSTETIP